MADLTIQGAHTHWRQYEDPIIHRVVSFMDSVEHWTQDGGKEFEKMLAKLSEELDDISKIDLDELGQQDLFIRINNHMHMSRALRFLQVLDTIHPGSASKLIGYSEENADEPEDSCSLFLRRNIVFERLRLLSRVFAAERFNLVLKALEGEDEHA